MARTANRNRALTTKSAPVFLAANQLEAAGVSVGDVSRDRVGAIETADGMLAYILAGTEAESGAALDAGENAVREMVVAGDIRPRVVLHELNQVYIRCGTRVSAAVILAEPSRVAVSAAGSMLPSVACRGQHAAIPMAGPALGISEAEFAVATLELKPEEVLIVASIGASSGEAALTRKFDVALLAPVIEADLSLVGNLARCIGALLSHGVQELSLLLMRRDRDEVLGAACRNRRSPKRPPARTYAMAPRVDEESQLDVISEVCCGG